MTEDFHPVERFVILLVATSTNRNLNERVSFREADAWRATLHISRSELFSKAMSEFIERRENRLLLDAINRAVEGIPR